MINGAHVGNLKIIWVNLILKLNKYFLGIGIKGLEGA
jgi:hypothetical protein